MCRKITASDIKRALSWETRIFFKNDHSEQEEEKRVVDYQKTAEKLNEILEPLYDD